MREKEIEIITKSERVAGTASDCPRADIICTSSDETVFVCIDSHDRREETWISLTYEEAKIFNKQFNQMMNVIECLKKDEEGGRWE